MKGNSRDRFKEIIKVFAYYGFGYVVDNKKNGKQKSPENLRKAIEELGSTFIKIGQILSTRTDILPEEYTKELAKLQDSVPAESLESLKKVFEEATKKNMDISFKYFSEKPLASASVAQVHKAVTMDGREVVVKIQRPNIKEKMTMDISILRRILKFTKTRINIEIVDPLEILDELERTTDKELDFINEGQNILKFKENNKNLKSIYAPDLICEFWSSRVIVLEEIKGFKINDREKLDLGGYDNKEVAKKLALSYCKQIFDDGFFHGDPHPGNILIYENSICFIDFGIMGVLDEGLRSWLNTAMLSIATRDKNKLVDCILAIGVKKGRIDKGVLYEDVSYLVDNYLATSLKNIKMASLLQEIFVITQKNKIQLPSELMLLIRGLIILEGVVAEVDPTFEIMDAVISFAKSKGKLGLLAGIKKEDVAISLYECARDGIRIPSKTLEVLNKISNGDTQIKFKIQRLDDVVSKLDGMVNRMTAGLITAALLVASSLVINSKVGPTTYDGLSIIGLIGYTASAIIALFVLYNMFKKKK